MVGNIAKLTVLIPLLSVLVNCSETNEVLSPQVRPVKSVVAVAENSRFERVYPGKTMAAEQVNLSFQVSGKLERLPVLGGQKVAKGDLIAALDSRDYESQVKAAKAELVRAAAEFKRIESLLDSKLISKSEFDQRQAAKDIAEANLEQAEKALSDTKLVAPFSGLLAKRHVDNFEDVAAKQPIASLQSIGNSKIVFHVPENQLQSRVDVSSYRFEASFSNQSDKKYLMAFREFSSVSDPVSQTYEAVFQLTEEPEFDVLSGMSISVTMTRIIANESEVVFWLPTTAVFSSRTGEDAQYVWVVEGNTKHMETGENSTLSSANNMKVRRALVTVGRLNKSQVEILSGLTGGERIVTAGVHYLQEGQSVSLDIAETFE